MSPFRVRWVGCIGKALLIACALNGADVAARPATAVDHMPVPGPKVDHHQHLFSPAATALLQAVDGPGRSPVVLPADIAALVSRRVAGWNDEQKLTPLYAEHALFFENNILVGRAAVVDALAKRFSGAFELIPIGFAQQDATATVVTKFVRGNPDTAIASLTLTLVRRDGGWQIAAESLKIPGPVSYRPIDAAALIQMLDDARIKRAVVLSLAYFYSSPWVPPQPDAVALTRAENDWTAEQVGRYPDRLVGFCSVNPLTPYAINEIRRCAGDLKLIGLKLHFANSGVDLAKPEHVAAVRAVFAEADRLRMPIVAHLWTTKPSYGADDSRIFLDQILPAAPDIVVQVAHMAGGGPGWTDDALGVFAEAIAAKDRRTRNLYFDVATVADKQSPERLKLFASRIRQIGVHRILYGSDGAAGGRDTAAVEWGTFRGMVPLTDAEFATIRDNVAPYLKRG